MDATPRQPATYRDDLVDALAGLVALFLVLCIGVDLFGLKCWFVGPSRGEKLGAIGFAGTFIGFITCKLLPSDWDGLVKRFRSLRWLRRPLQAFVLIALTATALANLESIWAESPGVGTPPVLKAREHYHLDSHGTLTEVSRLRYILAVGGFAVAWHGFGEFILSVELYHLLFSVKWKTRSATPTGRARPVPGVDYPPLKPVKPIIRQVEAVSKPT